VQLVQILYCSRTHSQLAQFVNEVKASPFGTSALSALSALCQQCHQCQHCQNCQQCQQCQ
jgi:hypothetical protein